jgi:hypothetical protein
MESRESWTEVSGLEVNDDGATFTAPRAFFLAAIEFSKARKPMSLTNGALVCDPARHPDTVVIREWLGRAARDASELDVILYLACMIRGEWGSMPHRTRSEHRALFQRIAKLCRELSGALNETGSMYIRGGGFGLEHLRVRELLTDSEGAEFEAALKRRDDGSPEPELPCVDELLERVASAANRLEKQGPLHAQPNKRGAERGYFVRSIGALLEQRYGEQPHEVIAALTTIALGEATDRELVAKLLA